MRLSLSEIMNLNHESRDYQVEIEMDRYSHMGVEYDFIRKNPVSIVLTSVGSKKVMLDAVIDLSLAVPCDRCLEAVEVPFRIEVKQRFDFNDETGDDGEDEDDVSYIIGYDLDVDAMVNEEIMIGFPMKVLCNEDCKGICKVCGANLNKGECGCDRTELDPRMSVIRDLFNDYNKEV